MNNKKYANLLNKIKMKGHMAKAVALAMCFVLFTTSVDITALAYTGDAGSDKEIVGISSLSDAITNQKVNIDATLEDIKLPESLDVHVSYQVEKEIEVEVEEEKATPTPTPSVEPTPSAEPTPSVEVKHTEESNQPDDTQNENPESQADGEQVAKITYGEYDSVETVYVPMTYYAAEPSKEEVVVETLEKSDVADISDDKKTESKTKIKKETVIEKVEEDDTVSVTWAIDEENSSKAEFKDLVAGEKYIFVPTITEDGYKLADGVELPTIKVTVDENQAAFEKSVTVDGVVITVTADEGVFPEDATIEARKVTTNEEKEVEEAIDEVRDDAKNVALSYTFDITVYDKDGNEIEPDTSKGSVKVTFKMAEIANENLETDVYHVEETDDGLNAEGLAVTNKGANTDDANIDGTNTDGGDASGSTNDEITVETTGFSFYTVEFTYGELQYVLEGDERVELTTILDAVGIKENGEISKAEGSDDELFKPVFDEEENVWYIESLKAFNTEEWLKVTIDGIEYEIVVTDDQAEEYYLVWIGGTQISRLNKADVLGDGGKVSFAPETNTLTLNGAAICTDAENTTDDAIYCNLPADKTLTINLIGSNVIGKAPSAFNIASGISSKGGAKLLLKGNEDSSLTIYAGGSGIKGFDISLGEEGENFEGKLKIYSLKTGIQAGREPAESLLGHPEEGEITIYGGDIDIESEENGLSVVQGAINLSDVTLNVTANTDSLGVSQAIKAEEGLNITGSACHIVARARLDSGVSFGAIFCPSVTKPEGTKVFGSTEWNAPKESITSEAALDGLYFKIGDDYAKAVILYICSVEQKSGQAATCTEDGWKDYYQCTNTSCSKIYASSSATGKSYADLAEWKASPEGKIERGHSWIYTASGAALTATCERDASHTATLTLTASDAVYSGSAVEATMDKSAWEAAGLTAPIVVYAAKTGSALTDGKAVNAGSYTASISKGTATASLDFSITKATSSVTTAPTANSLTYNGEDQALVSAGAATGGAMNYAIGADASTAPTSGWSSTIPTGKNAGTYYVWYKSAGDVNHSDSTPGCITVNVAKKEVTVSGITATNRGYIKDDKTVTLVTTGATLTGKVDGDDLSVTATGEMADANAGENKSVTIKNLTLAGAGKDNYELASSGQQTSTTVTITKASHTVTAPTARNPVYNGNEQVLISAGSCTTGTIKYSLDGTDYYDSIDSIKKKEIDSYTVFYKVEGDGNYETYGPKSITAKIVKKSDPTPTPTPTPKPDPQPTKNPDPQPNPQPTITVTSSVQYAETGNPIKNYVANNPTGSNIPLPFITTDGSKAGWKTIDEALDAHKANFKKKAVGTLSITMNGSTTVDTKLITDAHEKKIPLSFALDDEVAIGIPVANTVLSDQAKEGMATYFKVSSMTTAEAVGVKKAHAGLLPSDIVAIGGDANTPVVLTLCSNDKLSTKKSQLMTITFNAKKAGFKKGDKVYLYCGTSQNGIAMYKSGKVDKNGFVTFSVPMVSNYWTIGSKNTKNKLLRNAVALPR